jgi:peptidoglycan/LPS O-acetylase OafA/YrhL
MIRKNNYNLLRFLLASFVILCHNIAFLSDGSRETEILYVLFKSPINIGDFSVCLFFLISGYLIVKSWEQNKNPWVFLSNRILRIYPGFIVACLISCFVIGAFAGNTQYFEQFNYKNFIAGLMFLRSPKTPAIFANSFAPYINGSLWTINNEFICYLFVLFVGVISFFNHKNGWLTFFILFFSTLLLTIIFEINVINIFLTHHIVEDHFDIHLIFSFFIGGCYYLYGRAYLNRKSLYIISGILMLIFFFSKDLVEFALPIFGGYIVLSFAERNIPILSNFNRLPDISYGIYLYGWPISKIIIHYQPNISYWLLNFESFALVIILGLFSWYVVEKPFIMLKKKKHDEKKSSETTLVIG